MSLHFAVHVFIVQPFQVVGEPVIPARQQAEEGGLARPLAAHQAEHELELAARLEHPADGAQQKQPQRFFGVGVLIRAQKAVQAVTDAVLPVPHKGVEKVPDGMVAVFIGCHHDRILQLLFHHQTIGLLEVHEQILDVHVAQGGALPVPAQGLDHIHLPGEQIFADGPFQQRIALQHPFVVRHGVGDLSVFRPFQAECHRLGGGQFPWFLSHLIRQYASPPAALPFPFLFLFSFHIPPFAVGLRARFFMCTFCGRYTPGWLAACCLQNEHFRNAHSFRRDRISCFAFPVPGQNGGRGLGPPKVKGVWISKRYACKISHPPGEMF